MNEEQNIFRDFKKFLWESDLECLDLGEKIMAEKIFSYAVEELKSRPFHRLSARKKLRSDNHHIFKTRSADCFWGLLSITKTGQLEFHFPDKDDRTKSQGLFGANWRSGGQGKNKKEKEIILTGKLRHIKDFFPIMEEVHANAVDFYDRTKDSTDSWVRLFGEPDSKKYNPIQTPDNDVLENLISNKPSCADCGSKSHLSLYYIKKKWKLYCNEHHPKHSRWAAIGKKCIPIPVREYVWHRDGGKCLQCGSAVHIHFDHIIPRSFFGSNTENNIQLKCRSCNLMKGNKLIV